MAKRKRIAPPSADELAEMEAAFAPSVHKGPMAPIAQVAGEAAREGSVLSAEERADIARDQGDAEAYRAAKSRGALVLELPLDAIQADQMSRDRIALDAEEMTELKASVQRNGLRLPIEVYELRDPGAEARFGLLSGFRRLTAVQELFTETGDVAFATIRALVRAPENLAEAMTAMVEENEIRAALSHYERGRIAALAAHQGAFDSIDEAVAALFFAASKSKRSKIRSFALIHEELGDLLTAPQTLTERMGLRLANALRDGFAPDLRDALAQEKGDEWAAMEPLIKIAEQDQTEKRRRGGSRRAGKKLRASAANTYDLGGGRSLIVERDRGGFLLKLRGENVTADLAEVIALEIRGLLRRD